MSVRLVDLHPAWIDYDGRHGLGMVIDCMTRDGCVCKGQGRLWVLFANPLDGGPPLEGDSYKYIWEIKKASGWDGETPTWDRGCGTTRWLRTGDTFETLSNRPSLDAHECGHLTLTDGVFS